MANVLSKSKQVAIIHQLAEGSSMEATSRLLDVSPTTVVKLMLRVADGCRKLHHERVQQVRCARVECDEIWQYCGRKQKNLREFHDPGTGDTWTYVAIAAESKLVISYLVGKRDDETTQAFMDDLAMRLANRVQLTSDGFIPYVRAVGTAFAEVGCDFAQLLKSYEGEVLGQRKYSPPKITGIAKKPIYGAPEKKFVSTSFIERNNLNIRMGNRRFTRLTNAFSKIPKNHAASVDLYFAFYNFVRIHQTTRVTPAMAAGIEVTAWSVEELVHAAFARSTW